MDSTTITGQPPKENNIHLQETATLSAKTLITVSILLFYTIASSIISKFKLKMLHESGLSMILGILISMTAFFFNPNVNRFILINRHRLLLFCILTNQCFSLSFYPR